MKKNTEAIKQLNTPFTKRGKCPTNIQLDKDTFISLVDKFRQIGFKKIYIKLPLHEESSERGSEPVQIEKFLQVDRNYKSLILICSNPTEEIRILFKNVDGAKFYDDIFPSAGSNSKYNYYISSYEITRLYAIDNFIMDFFNENKVASIVSYLTIIFIVMLPIAYVFRNSLVLTINNFVIFLFSLILLIVAISFIVPQTGLYFHNPKDAKRFSEAIAKLKEQWLVLVIGSIVTFCFALLGMYLGSILGW